MTRTVRSREHQALTILSMLESAASAACDVARPGGGVRGVTGVLALVLAEAIVLGVTGLVVLVLYRARLTERC
jgi:hypothetical protein